MITGTSIGVAALVVGAVGSFVLLAVAIWYFVTSGPRAALGPFCVGVGGLVLLVRHLYLAPAARVVPVTAAWPVLIAGFALAVCGMVLMVRRRNVGRGKR